MSLDWDTTKVKYFNQNPDELWTTYNKGTDDEYADVNAETKALIFGTMAVGIGNLTIGSAADYYARWKIFEKYDDMYVYCWFEDNEKKVQYLTTDMLMKHIGLKTNVSNEAKKSWIDRMVKHYGYDKNLTDKPTVGILTKFYNQMVEEFNDKF